jgi:hypothetical protein
MSFKLPAWLVITVILAAFGGSVGFGYWLAVRGGSEVIQELRERAATDSVALDSVRAVLVDSIASLADSVARIESRVDTVRTRIPVAVQRAARAGETLAQHLTAQGDTAGLRLLNEQEEATTAVLALRVQESELLRAEVAVLGRQLALKDRIITEQDRAIAQLRADLAIALDEGDRLHSVAHPPLAVKLFRDLPTKLLWAGIGYGLSKLLD